MRVSSCDGILFPLLQHVPNVVPGIRTQVVVEGTRFDLVISSVPIQKSNELNSAANDCLKWLIYKFCAGVDQGQLTY